jgi:hypothetical protein
MERWNSLFRVHRLIASDPLSTLVNNGDRMESVMNKQRVRMGLLSNCGRLLIKVGRGCKSYILNDKAEQEWGEFAWVEAIAELRAQQSRAPRQDRKPSQEIPRSFSPSFFGRSE